MDMIKLRKEHDKCQQGKPTQLGLMLEITAPAAPVVAATQHKTKSIVFVIDRSGSMAGERLQVVLNTIEETLPRLHPEDFIAVVSFDDQAIVNVALNQVKNHKMAEVIKSIRNISAGGSTNLEAGYRLGLEQAKSAPSGIETTIILLSDGQANQGVTDPVVLGQLATQATEHLVVTTTMGIGGGYDENILGAMADGGNGNHIAAIKQGEALDGLQAEIDGLLLKTMLEVRFDITIGPDFLGSKTNIIAGRRMKQWKKTHGHVETLLGDVAGGEQKNVVFDLILDGHEMATPGKKQGVKVEWEYIDALTGNKISNSETIEVELVAADKWTEPDRDIDIVGELKAVRMQQIWDEAERLFDQGKHAEANALLEAAGKDLQDFMARNHLGDRTSMRLMQSSEMFLFSAYEGDINAKRKMMKEFKNRQMRDRKPRDQEGN
jgi:Ca-activated chloride channel family protein